MKLFLLSVCLLGAVAGYEVGKEYVYEYDGKIHVTQPDVPTQSSALAFKGKVVVQPKAEHLHLKIADFETGTVNWDDVDIDTYQFPYQSHPSLTENLERPFGLKFTNGKFVNIELGKSEPLWSHNVKKALASLIQVDLSQVRSAHHADEEYKVYEESVSGVCETVYVLSPGGHHTPGNHGVHGGQGAHAGHGEHAAPAGHVEHAEPTEVVPTAEHGEHGAHGPHGGHGEHGAHGPHGGHGGHGGHGARLEIIKVRNAEKCTKTPSAFYGSFRGEKCESCESKEHRPFVNTAEVRVGVRGTPQNFVVEHACSTTSQVYVPFNEGKVVTIYVNRTLTLEEEREVTADIALPEDREVITTLLQTLPETGNLQNPDDLKHRNAFFDTFHLGADKEKLVNHFNELTGVDFTEEDYKDALHKTNAPEKFTELVYAFGSLTYEEIVQFYEHNVVNVPEERKENVLALFVDLLGATGSNQQLAFGLELIRAGKFEFEDAKRFFSNLPYNVKEPSEALLHAIINTCKTDFVKSNERVKAACLTAVGTLIETSCHRGTTEEEEDAKFCRFDIVGRFFNHSVTPADVVDMSNYLTKAYIEIGGKLATRKSIRNIAQFVSPHQHCPVRRQTALWALGQAAPKQPLLVRHYLLPIYFNTSESHSIRIAAFVGAMGTDPELSLLRHIATELIHDPSDQVAAYVASFFRQVEKSHYPCDTALARRLKYVVPLLNNVVRFREKPKETYSRIEISSGYDEKYNYGGASILSVIRSEDSYLPRSFYLSAKDFIAGYSHDTFSVAYQGWGVDKLFSSTAAPRVGSKRNLWNFFGKRRLPRDADEREQLKHALPIATRGYDPFHVDFTVKLFGHNVEAWEFNEETLKSLNRPGSSDGGLVGVFTHVLGREFKTKHFYLSRDHLWMFPTDVGFPAFLDVKQADFFYANRHQMTVEEEGAALKLGLERHYLYDSFGYEWLGIGLTFNKTSFGVGYHKRLAVSLPLNLQATYDMMTHKFKLEKPLTLPVDLFHYSFQPYSFIEPFDDTVGSEPALTHLPLYNDEELRHFDRTYFTDFLGYGLHVKGHMIDKGHQKSLHHFWYEMDWRQRLYYLFVNPHWHPRAMSIQVIPAEKDATKSVELDIAYKCYGADDVQRHSEFAPTDASSYGGHNTSAQVLNVNLYLRGETKKRSVKTELSYTYSHDLLKHWVKFFYDRTPFHEHEKDHKKICIDTTATFPRPEWAKLEKLAAFYQGKTVDAKANVAYGADCITDPQGSRIFFHGTYEHTHADAEEINDIASGLPPSKNRFKQRILRKLYQKCRFYQDQGIKLNYFCVKYLYHSSRLGRLNLDVEYHNLKPLLPPAYHRYHSYHKHDKKHADFFTAIFSHLEGPDGKLHVVSEVKAFSGQRTANVTVTDGKGHVYKHEGVPTASHLLEPRVFYMLGYTNLQEYSAQYKHKTCDLQGHSLRTFDGVVVDLPETDCYKVVARDCSPYNAFTVLAKATESTTFPKAVKIFLANVKIEIGPVETGPVVLVNDQKVQVTKDQPYRHVVDGAELFYIEAEQRYYHLQSNSHGLYVHFNGQLLFVQAAPFYRGKLCGLCGNYNYERNHELLGPDNHLYDNTQAFARSYVVPSDTCHLS